MIEILQGDSSDPSTQPYMIPNYARNQIQIE